MEIKSGEIKISSSAPIGWTSGDPNLAADISLARVAVAHLKLYGTHVETSGTIGTFSILPTYNQASGTAVNTDLLINRVETAIGSGAQLLIDAQVGGVSKFTVDSVGKIVSSNRITSGDSFFAAAARGFSITGRLTLRAESDGVATIADSTFTSFERLQLGGSTSSYPALKRNSAALEARLADNSGGALMIRNDTYGFIYVSGGSTAQTSITTTVKVTGFATDGPSNDLTSAAASDKITIDRPGAYRVNFSASFTTSANNVVVRFVVNIAGTPTVVSCARKIGTGSDEGNCSCEGIIDIAATQDVEVFDQADASTSMTPTEMQLSLTRVGE